MLVPDINKVDPNFGNDMNTIEIESFDVKADFYNMTIHYEEKSRIKFIKYIEKIVRSSFEYRTYIGFLKNKLDLTRCTFFPMVNINEIRKVSFEFHHYPFNLFNIVSIVLDEHMLVKGEKNINPFDIAEEVMLLHYQNYIGLVPLTVTVHELAHEGKVFINLKYVYGNYNKFINLYESALSDNYRQLIANAEMLSEKEDREGSPENEEILSKFLMEVKVGDEISIPETIKVEEDMLA